MQDDQALAGRRAPRSAGLPSADGEWSEPHTKAFGDGLFELQLKGAEGIARVFYCTLVGRRIVMLHCFVKKTQKTPLKERWIAKKRMMEVKQ